jgi:hypothetical protein
MKKWYGLRKAAEECGELVVELMKLATFPDGKHPARKRSLVISTEEELADVMAAVDYFIDRNKLDRAKIEKRKAAKYKKFTTWWGDPKPKGLKAKSKELKRVLKATKQRA